MFTSEMGGKKAQNMHEKDIWKRPFIMQKNSRRPIFQQVQIGVYSLNHLLLRFISTLLKLEISTLLKTITNSCFQALEGLKFQAWEGLKFQDKQTQKQMIRPLISVLKPEKMFGSRPEKNDPEIDKMNFWFTLIGPLS